MQESFFDFYFFNGLLQIFTEVDEPNQCHLMISTFEIAMLKVCDVNDTNFLYDRLPIFHIHRKNSKVRKKIT